MLTPELADFYEKHGVHGVEDYLSGGSAVGFFPSRFLRLNPRFDREETISMLVSELPDGCFPPKPVPWLDTRLGFYAVGGNFPLSRSRSFRSGRVYGMDVSSGAAVAALLLDCYDVVKKNDDNSNNNSKSCSDTTNDNLSAGNMQKSEKRAKSLRVLDLCCSPGLKLCSIADILDAFPSSTVVGVDISKNRTSVCKSIVQKYRIDKETSGRSDDNEAGTRVRLFCEDGTKFGLQLPNELVFDSKAALLENESSGKRKRMNKSARAREKKRLHQLLLDDTMARKKEEVALENTDSCADTVDSSAPTVSIEPFDRVLVDAECSTDGSLKHMLHRIHPPTNVDNSKKTESKENITSNEALTDSQQLADLVELQRELIASGFRLLKPGGVMVYSTCSLAKAQNEDVVSWLLEEYSTAQLIAVNFSGPSQLGKQTIKKVVSQGSLPGTIRFQPNLTSSEDQLNESNGTIFYGGGLFLAKIRKIH